MAGPTIGLPGTVCPGAEARMLTMRRLSKGRFRSPPFTSIRRIMGRWERCVVACGLLRRCVGPSALRRAIRALYAGIAKRHRDGGSMVRQVWRGSRFFRPDASDRPDLHLVAGRHRRCKHLSVYTLYLSRFVALVLSSGLCRRENGRALGAAERLLPPIRYCDRRRARLGHRLLCVVALAKAPAETGVIGSRC